jgi:hypothetical protein
MHPSLRLDNLGQLPISIRVSPSHPLLIMFISPAFYV